jgi:D-glycero-D-manno-heptose 1,7-bisphosphate phosphatase
MIKLIILDRDGVINEDSAAFIKSPEEWQAIPGSLEAIVKLNQAGIKVAIASNQSGISRKLLTKTSLARIHKKMVSALTQLGGHIDAIVFCPHGPDDNCACRKPKIGLLLELATKFRVHPSEVIVIGDSLRDLLAAQTFGCKAILVKTGKGTVTAATLALENIAVFPNLATACNALLEEISKT